ncbi:hypothetical protein [Acinetobacter soli]|uniref:hypothetical protein n=1 Tax=Acinetobacter soli TaxID=487316 RepID=UPI000B4C8617|nr:hypothetical protein [Acinetobacter soli]
MNSAAELKRFEADSKLQKDKHKVMSALANDPVGLSISQLMTVCRLSNKTVKRILEEIEADNNAGVYSLNSSEESVTTPAETQNETIEAHSPQPTKVERCGISLYFTATVNKEKGKIEIGRTQLSQLLKQFFGMNKVEWCFEDGVLTGVNLSNEI